MEHPTDYRLRHLQDLIGGQYCFEGALGRGGAAIVYKVTNLRLSRPEALKVLDQDHLNVPDFGRRFTREAKLAAALDHPNIVKVYDFGMEEGLFWYTMQYIDGPTLAHVLHSRGALSAPAVARIAVPLLDALHYIHEHGVVHRDVKPGNIILDTACRPYLMDFGIAKSLDSLKKTQTILMLGTPAYLSPEQVAGGGVDGRSDIYSMGVTFYELLTGKLPFSGDSAFESILSRMHNDPDPLTGVRPDLDPRFQEIVMRSLEREREKRFATAAEMRDCFLSLPQEDRVPPGSAGGTAPDTETWLRAELGLAEWSDAGRASRAPATVRPVLPKRRRYWLAGAGLTAVIWLAVAGIWVTRSLRKVPDRPGAELPASRAAPTPAPSLVAGHKPSDVPQAPPPESSRASGTPAIKPAAALNNLSQPARSAAGGDRVGSVTAEPPARRPVQPPQLLERTPVQLPEGLAERCRGQKVAVSATIGEDGLVKRSRLLSTVPPECGRAALEAVRLYVYQPALDAAGKPVEATIGISVELY